MSLFILNESVKQDIKDTKSEVSTFYEHMLKWKYWEPKREENSNSWCNSIFRSIYMIQKIMGNNTNVKKWS